MEKLIKVTCLEDNSEMLYSAADGKSALEKLYYELSLKEKPDGDFEDLLFYGKSGKTIYLCTNGKSYCVINRLPEKLKKLHKIRNVEKDVCTKEQVYVYNRLTSIWVNFSDQYNSLDVNDYDKKSELINKILKMEMDILREKEEKRVDHNSVLEILKNNIVRYIGKGTKICTDYREVGELILIPA